MNKLSIGLRVLAVLLFVLLIIIYICDHNWPAVSGWGLALLFSFSGKISLNLNIKILPEYTIKAKKEDD